MKRPIEHKDLLAVEKLPSVSTPECESTPRKAIGPAIDSDQVANSGPNHRTSMRADGN